MSLWPLLAPTRTTRLSPCYFEGDERKSSAGHVKVEQYLESVGAPYTVFQPQYIYGPHTAKVHRCILGRGCAH